jgi:hypothetical protein
MTMKRESKDAIFFETVERGKGGSVPTMRGRYHYAGPCNPEDGLMKADKDGEVCTQARAQAASTNPAVVCAKHDGEQKAECIRKVEASLEQTRKLCE